MEWKRGPLIGRGSSAVVSIASTASGKLFAVKSTDLSCSSLLQKEKYLISMLSSPYVVKCLGSDVTCENQRPVYNLFFEYVSGGTLSDQIIKQGGSLGESLIQFYTHQMLEGLNYLHVNGLVHCDIKGQNILIGKDGVKIADFGCAKLMQEGGGSSKSAFSGTPAYMAPEVARGEEQGFPADIWALGCTIIEMATGLHPWQEMEDPVSALYRIGYSGKAPENPSWLSDNAKELLTMCFMKDPNDRWTAAQLLKHPFFHTMEENFEFTRKTPTSVMDQRFWDSLESTDSSPNATHIFSSSNSPADRIRHLITYGNSSLPDWAGGGDWLTVRCSQIEEISNPTFSSSIEEDIQTSILIEDSSFDCFSDYIRIIENILSIKTFLVTSEENVKDVSASTIIYFLRMLMELVSLIQITFLTNSYASFCTIFLVLPTEAVEGQDRRRLESVEDFLISLLQPHIFECLGKSFQDGACFIVRSSANVEDLAIMLAAGLYEF
ncbi:mitogen-activated protein kinase kinase kinase 18-like [Olea europaea var. sylvestris]|uniref:mitogen-activated protein kinase kinase kinase 18-like n=1 Tax=Olea europaea var. sylvestris TaxID=158386 RepID=UPI000C1D7C35|nr:mitogen-activated protein kinase kinase kinase 18-like [Olea europaea var. sylvestris]